MVGLLVAPYNDSMRLGQGYNSFLQMPCIDNAVSVDATKVVTEKGTEHSPLGCSQVVSYSSRFISKMSDVVRSMNISAGASIKSGSIDISGNSMSVDELKFAESDLNAVVSVKVVNQTTMLQEDAKFLPIEGISMDSAKFFDFYGDCYISGFVEGGDLHGIVSIKVLDASKKGQVEAAIKGQMNGGGSASGDFILNEGAGSSTFGSALKQTETTISVNWSGGGQIKSEEMEEWSLETLFKVAAGFPARVAACPQRTWAILTKYDNNRHFLRWADKRSIKIPQYNNVGRYTSDLLDMYMQYKNNLALLNDVLSSPSEYTVSNASDSVNLTISALVDEKKAIKKQMEYIVKEIDILNERPQEPHDVEERSNIKSPELWAARLPVKKNSRNGAIGGISTPHEVLAQLTKFPFEEQPKEESKEALTKAVEHASEQVQTNVQNKAVQLIADPFAPKPADPLCSAEIESKLNPQDREFVRLEANKIKYAEFRFDQPQGNFDTGGPYNDAITLKDAIIPVSWPKRVEFRMVTWGTRPILGSFKTIYDQISLAHGTEKGGFAGSLVIDLEAGEKINYIRLGEGSSVWGVEGISFIELRTTSGRIKNYGSEEGLNVINYWPPQEPWVGLKGFFGGSGDVIDRIAPIWGREH